MTLSSVPSLAPLPTRFGVRGAPEDRGGAGAIYRELGEESFAARTLLATARVYREMGAVDEAIEAARAASATFQAEGDEELYLCAQHEIICALADGERYLEAHGARAVLRLFRDAARVRTSTPETASRRPVHFDRPFHLGALSCHER